MTLLSVLIVNLILKSVWFCDKSSCVHPHCPLCHCALVGFLACGWFHTTICSFLNVTLLLLPCQKVSSFISNLCGLFLTIYCYDLIFLLTAITLMNSNLFTTMSMPLLSKYAIFYSCVVMLTPPMKCFQDVGKFLYSNFHHSHLHHHSDVLDSKSSYPFMSYLYFSSISF